VKKPEIHFRPIGQSGPLSLYWHSGPYGDAVECIKGKGVAWVSSTGDLLGVEFDDVDKVSDHQFLLAPQGTKVEVWIENEKVKAKTHHSESETA